MTSTIRIILHSRSGHWALLATIAMCSLAAATGRRAIEIDLSAQFPPAKLAIIELYVIVTATLLAILTRPRFWEWDRIARGHRPQAVAGAVAAATIALAALCVPAVVPWLPTNTPLDMGPGQHAGTRRNSPTGGALLNPLLAGALTLVFWLSSGVTANLAPHLWLPLAHYHHPNGHWTAAALLTAAAIAVHTRTCGATAWAHRQLTKGATTSRAHAITPQFFPVSPTSADLAGRLARARRPPVRLAASRVSPGADLRWSIRHFLQTLTQAVESFLWVTHTDGPEGRIPRPRRSGRARPLVVCCR
jgi:hypothetical protein